MTSKASAGAFALRTRQGSTDFNRNVALAQPHGGIDSMSGGPTEYGRPHFQDGTKIPRHVPD